MSPVLFNLFINSLVNEVKALDIGVDINGEKICILLYGDDVILLAEKESDLQLLLDILHCWCQRNKMSVNLNKSKVMHFRNKSVQRTAYVFKYDGNEIDIVDQYLYLGLLLTEYLDYELMAKNVSKSANRALGLLIVKSKQFGGFSFETFTKLYDTLVWSVISYGSAIWGFKEYTCINAVQNRAMRFFMGVGKYTPNDAVQGDMGWKPVCVRQWSDIFRHWSRLLKMDNDRLNFKVFEWSFNEASRNRKNWCFKVKKKLEELQINEFFRIDEPICKTDLTLIENTIIDRFILDWKQRLLSYDHGKKLRTYKCFKNEYCTENYILCHMPKRYRSAFAKFRCGVAPLRIETGRYERLQVNERVCFNCNNMIEDEEHVLLHCPLYSSERFMLFEYARMFYQDFDVLTDKDKLIHILQDSNMCWMSAKICYLILLKRNSLLYT